MTNIIDIITALKKGDTDLALDLAKDKDLWEEKEILDYSRVDYQYSFSPDVMISTEMAQSFDWIISTACKNANALFLEKISADPQFAKLIQSSARENRFSSEFANAISNDNLDLVKALAAGGFETAMSGIIASQMLDNPKKLNRLLDLDKSIKDDWQRLERGESPYNFSSSFPAKPVTVRDEASLPSIKNHAPSWKYNPEILNLIMPLEQAYKSGEITGHPQQWAFSAEIEIQLGGTQFLDDYYNHPNNVGEVTKLVHDRADIMRELERRYSEIEPGSAAAASLKMQMEKLPGFLAPDIIMWHIYDRLGDNIEFRCGRETHGEGYYDNPAIGEARVHPFKPDGTILTAAEFISRYHTVTATIKEVAEEFGKEVYMFSPHVGFSENRLHTDGRIENLTDCTINKDERLAHAKTSSEGILRVFNACNSESPYYGNYSYEWGQARSDSFRTRRHSTECRNSGYLGNGSGAESIHLADLLLRIISGAALGHQANAEEKERLGFIPSATSQFMDVTDKSGGDSFYTARVLESAIIQPDGGLKISETYISAGNRGHQVINELFGADLNPDSFVTRLMGKGEIPEEFQKILHETFSRIRLDENNQLDISRIENWENPPKLLSYKTDDKAETIHVRIVRNFHNIKVEGIISSVTNYAYCEPDIDKSADSLVLETVYGENYRNIIKGEKTPDTKVVETSARLGIPPLTAVSL